MLRQGTLLVICALAALLSSCGDKERVLDSGPINFGDPTTRSELTVAAQTLMTLPSGRYQVQPGGATGEALPPAVAGTNDRLAKYAIRSALIDSAEGQVTLAVLQGRLGYRYIYSLKPLPAPYTDAPILRRADFRDWHELNRIAAFGLNPDSCARNHIAFEPAVVYPHLVASLGQQAVDSLATHDSLVRRPTQQASLLVALQHQAGVDSRLIEDSLISYDAAAGYLTLRATRIGRTFWAVRLLDTLIADRVIVLAQDGKHLRLTPALTPKDAHRVGWLHVGIMNFLYGNLLHKPDPWYDAALGDGWYVARN